MGTNHRQIKCEEILDKHISKMLRRLPDSFNELSELKDQPEYQCTIDAMEEYAEHQIDIVFNLFDKPLQKLRPLENLYRKENPLPNNQFYSPDKTKFYEWITNKILNNERK